MIDTLWLDTETRSERDIKKGTYQYAEGLFMDVASWAIGYGEPEVLDFQTCTKGDVTRFKDILHESRRIFAHNAMFDRNALRLGDLKIEIPIDRWRCVMVQALAHGLPGALEKLGPLFGLTEDQAKMKEGRDLMLLFCKPRPKNHKVRWATAQTHPEERAKYLKYCERDVTAMRMLQKRLPVWNLALDYPKPGEVFTAAHAELAHYHRDQRLNDRGFLIDEELVERAIACTKSARESLKEEIQEATGGAVESATKRDQLLEYLLLEYGVELPDLKASTLERRAADPDLDEGLRELLRIRLAASTSSVAKFKTLATGVCEDGVMRGTIQMNGAARTRRAAGRLFQPQNLPSRGLLKRSQIVDAIDSLMKGRLEEDFPNVMQALSSLIRPAIIARKGKKMRIADLSNIEGRGLAWLAGEEWKLQAFRDFDTLQGADGKWYGTRDVLHHRIPLMLDDRGEPIRKGPDLYKAAYAKSFGIDHTEVTKPQRQIGKVQELACGYQGSINAFITFAAVYGIDLDVMAEQALPTLPLSDLEAAEGLLDWMRSKKIKVPALPRRTLIVILCMVYGWRAAHPNTKALWKGLENTAAEAIVSPGHTLTWGRFKFRREGAWLRILAPSGRSLCYPHPKLWKGKISYTGVNQYTHKWGEIFTYGGKLTENATQMFAGDVLYDAHPAIELCGYDIILHVHDENAAETAEDEDYLDEDRLSWLMSKPPSFDGFRSYAPDLPLAAAGFSDYRYGKDD